MTDFARAPDTPPAPAAIPGFCDAANRKWVLIAAILASALGFIDGTIVAIALPAMRDSLGASLPEAQWISNSYMLTLSALILVGGAMGDRFGVARIFGGGIALFVAASAACALAPTPGLLIAARALQGLGAAFMVPGSMAIIARAYPRAERGRALGIWAAASAVTTALGPIAGGLLLTTGGPEAWRLIFAVNLPLGAVALWLLATRVARDPGQPGRGVDYAGALLATAGLGLIAWALTGAEHGAAGGLRDLALGGAGLGLLGVFVLWERRVAHPMMQVALLADRSFAAVNIATFFLYFALSAILFFLPMAVIGGWGVREIAVTAAFAPLSVFIGGLSARAGALADRVGAGPVIAAGAAVVALSFAALGLAAPFRQFWPHVFPAMIAMGLGMAAVVAPLSAAVMAAVEDADTGSASGINNAVARIAGLVAVAAMGSLAVAVYGAAGGEGSFGSPPATPADAAAADRAFAAIAFTTAALAALAAAVAGFGIRPPPGRAAAGDRDASSHGREPAAPGTARGMPAPWPETAPRR